MSAGGDGFAAVAGGTARHIPVLCRRAIEFLKAGDGGVYIDATFGAGGYTRAILGQAGTQVIGIDRDPHAIALGADLVQAANGRLTLIEDQFSHLDAVARNCGYEAVDGVVLDLGVSSMQLDTPQRGFSFRHDGPLDMRMGTHGPSAADIVARSSERDLANIIFLLGEERHSRSVARAIVKARQLASIETTAALADIVARVVRLRPGDIHPATRTFQALRIFVNDELGELVAALEAAERVLKPGGRLAAVSFHSLEDRIVKSFLSRRAETRGVSRHAPEIVRAAPSFHVLTKRPVMAEAEEVARNPRARSAKLRAAERTEAPEQRSDASDLLPRLPALADIMKGH
jgi:16S rRNA (cytosine1402-N4)-methyltransferase